MHINIEFLLHAVEVVLHRMLKPEHVAHQTVLVTRVIHRHRSGESDALLRRLAVDSREGVDAFLPEMLLALDDVAEYLVRKLLETDHVAARNIGIGGAE